MTPTLLPPAVVDTLAVLSVTALAERANQPVTLASGRARARRKAFHATTFATASNQLIATTVPTKIQTSVKCLAIILEAAGRDGPEWT